MDSLWGPSVKHMMIQRRLAWPLAETSTNNNNDNDNNNSNSHFIVGTLRFFSVDGFDRRGLPPPILGGIYLKIPFVDVPYPSYPALQRQDTTHSWNSDDRRYHTYRRRGSARRNHPQQSERENACFQADGSNKKKIRAATQNRDSPGEVAVRRKVTARPTCELKAASVATDHRHVSYKRRGQRKCGARPNCDLRTATNEKGHRFVSCSVGEYAHVQSTRN